MSVRKYGSASSSTPMTCGAQRSEYRSWSRCSLRGGRSVTRSARSRAATRCWPAWGFAAKSVSSKWCALPALARTLKAVSRVASRDRYSARSHARHARAVITAVPFMMARPSFGRSLSGAMPSDWSTCAAGLRSPRYQTSRSPQSTAAT